MRALDFIVFGVGRSGTTALATSLNLHGDILCGIERFHYNVAPVLIDFPHSFEDTSFKCNALHLEATRMLFASKGPGVAFAGNKHPRYYCNLDAWRTFKPDLRKIAIYRSPYEYLASWQQRAANPVDDWHNDLQGVFGIYRRRIASARQMGARPHDGEFRAGARRVAGSGVRSRVRCGAGFDAAQVRRCDALSAHFAIAVGQAGGRSRHA